MSSTRGQRLNRAFQLAFFIHGDQATAVRIATDAMDKLDVALAAQDKRRYYTLAGRLLPEVLTAQRFRLKVSMSEPHLLQRLIYIESDPYEQQQERGDAAATLDEEDMIIRFIKYLVEITIKRNSFYVTVGLSRLLHSYSTTEAQAIHDQIIQDPARIKGEQYYRSRKKQLMDELRERFGEWVRPFRVAHGEERFQAQENPGQHAELVRRSLSLFTPWDTPCVIPAGFDPMRDELPALSFEGPNPDEEHRTEVNRFHAVLHPECFERLTEALQVDPPDQRLAVPQFFVSRSDDGQNKPRRDRRHLPQLSEEELVGIESVLADRAARRRVASAGLLSIMVDGRERTQFDPARSSQVQFEVDEKAQLVEVRAREKEGDLVLAVCLLDFQEGRAGESAQESSITLKGGQRISFAVSLKKDPEGEVRGAQVTVKYQETHAARAVKLFGQRLKYRIADAMSVGQGMPGILKPVLVTALIAACAFGLAQYMRLREKPSEPQLIAKREPPSTEQDNRPTPAMPPSSSQPGAPATGIGPSDIGPRSTMERGSELAAESLLAVKRVYIAALGDDAFSQHVRDQLINQLQASGRFAVTDNPDEADAAMKGSTESTGTAVDESTNQTVEIGQVTLQLVSADGRVLWATAKRKYAGRAEAVAAEVVRAVLGEIRRLDRQQRKSE